jgi:hypothetical protein
MIHGIHDAFLVMGVWTMFSTFIFRGLRPDDGEAVSQHGELEDAEPKLMEHAG